MAEVAGNLSPFFWLCVGCDVLLLACLLLCDTFSLWFEVFFLFVGWVVLLVTILLARAFDERPKWVAGAPLASHICILLLMLSALGVSEPLAWALKKSTMQRAAERIAREHLQIGDAPLRANER